MLETGLQTALNSARKAVGRTVKIFPALLFLLLITACREQQPQRTEPTPIIESARTGAEIFHDCQLCHGTREMQRGPILDGLPAWYVRLQMEKFREGIRGNLPENRSEHLMGSAAGILQDDAEIARVASHIQSLPPQPYIQVVRGDAGRGKELYAQCAPCHGVRGEGKPELKSPPLNIQEDWYLLDQMRHFKSGLRGHHERDVEGKIMAAATQPLSNTDLRDVVRYISDELSLAVNRKTTESPAREQ